MALDPITAGLEFGSKVVGVLDDLFTSDEERAEAKRRMSGQQGQEILSGIKEQVKVIVAEAQSDSFLAKNWRPITMLAFVVIIVNNYILFPYLQLFFNSGAMLDIPPDMWDLLKLGLGGYVVGRSAEKAAKAWKDK